MNTDMMWHAAIYQFASLSLLFAAVLFWMRSKSVWMLLAIVAQAASIVAGYVPLMGRWYVYPLFHFVQPAASAAFAVALVAYAWTEYKASMQRAAQGNAP